MVVIEGLGCDPVYMARMLLSACELSYCGPNVPTAFLRLTRFRRVLLHFVMSIAMRFATAAASSTLPALMSFSYIGVLPLFHGLCSVDHGK